MISVSYDDGDPTEDYHQALNITRTKSQNQDVFHLVLKLSLLNPLKAGV